MRSGVRVGVDAGDIQVFRTDFDKWVILSSFEQRGWTRTEEDGDEWDLYWASVHTVRQLFNPDSGRRLADHQIINHFPNHYELTRKDLMARNIKRYRKETERTHEMQRQAFEASAGVPPPPSTTDEYELPAEWVPTTFALPSDYALFVEEFRRNPNATWIAKPTGKAQGRGIFLVSKLNQLKKWSTGQKASLSNGLFKEPYVISRYLQDPLLVGGKKFDLRLYVLVTSYRPMKAYLYRGGFCRFCVEQYSTDVAEIDNVFVHLTNVALQKHSEDYNTRTGGKWAIEDLLLFIESTRGVSAKDKLLNDMEAVIAHSLKAVQGVMINDRHCFEMYGFDILLDSSLRPWLLEVNASPSLSVTTTEDRLLKLRLIHDVLGVVVASRAAAANPEGGCLPTEVGGWVCLVDEGRRQREEELRRSAGRGDKRRLAPQQRRAMSSGGPSGWR